MKTNGQSLTRFVMAAVTLAILATLTVSVGQAAPPLQDPRPPAKPGNGGGGNGGGNGVVPGRNGDTGNGAAKPGCASVVGQAINWGFGPQEGVGITLTTGSWQLSTASASDGNYGLGGLGVGVARLRISLALEPDETLDPVIQEAGVYLNCDFPTIANVAVASGPVIEPPATIEMTAPGRLTADSQTPLKITIQNNLPNEITNVIVTNLMPPGLSALDVAAAAAEPRNIQIVGNEADGQLAVVYLERLAAGDEANIIITVTASQELPPGSQVTNTATLFYRESVAVQDSVDFTIGRSSGLAPQTQATPVSQVEAGPTSEPPPTPEPVATPVAVATPASTADEAEAGEEAFVPPPGDMPGTGGQEAIPPDGLPVTGDEAYPPPALLPETGFKLTAPLIGVGLVGLAFLAHLLRTAHHRRE